MSRREGYARVSTKGQARNGNSLEDQTAKLKAAGCSEIVVEAYTGTTMERPKLDELLSRLEPGDELVVCKLDRLARTAAEGSILVRDLLKRGVSVNILNMGKADNTAMGQLMVTILLAFAEYERDSIVDRTQSGKAVARANNPNFREGRAPMAIHDEFGDYLARVMSDEMTVTDACKALEISRSTWYKWVKQGA